MIKYIKPVFVPTPIIDNLTSTDTDKALSANQGKVLDDKITTLSITITNSVVDSLSGNETDKTPSVHIVKDALDKKVDLINNKVPLNQLPNEIVFGSSGDNVSDIVDGEGITITRGTSNRYVVSLAPTDQEISDKFSNIKKAKLPSSLKYRDICYSNDAGKFIAIAEDSDKAVVSSNGKDWVEVTLPAQLKYSSITYSNKMKKVCIVAKDSNQAVVSNNLTDFTIHALPKKLDYVDVVAVDNVGTGMFVALSSTTSIMISIDGGINWVEKTIAAPTHGDSWNSICYNSISKQLVVVGDSGAILMSQKITDTTNIVFTDRSLSNNTINLSDVCYSRSLDRYCAAVSNDNTNKVYVYDCDDRYTNGWREVTLPSSSSWIKVTYIPFYKRFFILSGSADKACVSTDGDTWEDVSLPALTSTDAKYSSVACCDQLTCMCMTVDGANTVVVVNVDMIPNITWQMYNLPTQAYWQSICWAPQIRRFCVVAQNTTANAISEDGMTWRTHSLPTNLDWRSVCWSSELQLFCAVGYGSNKAATSPDGITWTLRTLPSITYWQRICWSPELRMYCAVAFSSNKAATSPDGITWTERSLPFGGSWYGICWSPELRIFCSIANNANKVATSSDGITWTERSLPINSGWYSICWSPKLRIFCIVSSNSNKYVVSSDGITWTERSLPPNEIGVTICWSPEFEMFCCINSSMRKVLTSTDGIKWQSTMLSIGGNDGYTSVCWAPELQKFCAIAYNGSTVILGTPE